MNFTYGVDSVASFAGSIALDARTPGSATPRQGLYSDRPLRRLIDRHYDWVVLHSYFGPANCYGFRNSSSLRTHRGPINRNVTVPIPNNWYESFFHGLALDLWRKAIPPEQTKAEAEFLVNHLNCESGAQLLDLPCGNGRLSFEMAKRGYQVTGVDISVEFIEEAHASVTRLINPPSEAGGTDYLP